jgi:hypothetical protein
MCQLLTPWCHAQLAALLSLGALVCGAGALGLPSWYTNSFQFHNVATRSEYQLGLQWSDYAGFKQDNWNPDLCQTLGASELIITWGGAAPLPLLVLPSAPAA